MSRRVRVDYVIHSSTLTNQSTRPQVYTKHPPGFNSYQNLNSIQSDQFKVVMFQRRYLVKTKYPVFVLRDVSHGPMVSASHHLYNNLESKVDSATVLDSPAFEKIAIPHDVRFSVF